MSPSFGLLDWLDSSKDVKHGQRPCLGEQVGIATMLAEGLFCLSSNFCDVLVFLGLRSSTFSGAKGSKASGLTHETMLKDQKGVSKCFYIMKKDMF